MSEEKVTMAKTSLPGNKGKAFRKRVVKRRRAKDIAKSSKQRNRK